MLVAGAILLTVRNWTSWSDRPFIMEHVEDELSLVISTKYYRMPYLNHFEL
jgi:hypothetical protein